MKPLKRIRYYTMNSWNESKSLAYNLKIYNVIDNELRDKVYELLDCDEFHENINMLINDFDREHEHNWQAGFNGRSGGYLVLYKGGKHTKHITKDMFKSANGYNGRAYISDGIGWKSFEEAKAMDILDKTITTGVYTQPGLDITEEEVPPEVKKSFRQLAIDIVKQVEYMAKNCNVMEEEYTKVETRKVIA